MRLLLLGLAATAATALSSGTGSAQFFRNVIANSGNGAGNVIIAKNRGAPQGFGFDGPMQGYMTNRIVNSGNGVGNVIQARNVAGFGGYPGGFAPAGYPGGYGGGFNPVGYGGYAPGGIPGFGGLNMNIVTNSGNGIGNQILTGNRNGLPGGININVITNSGNGAGNVIGAKNR
jgi:hypothetical protein